MHSISATVLSMILILGCRSKDQENTENTSPEWWETETSDTETDNDQEDDGENTDDEELEDTAEKPDDEGWGDTGIDTPECGEDFDSTEPCEGDWTTTLCVDDGVFWWCDNGVWLNEDDK